MTTHNICFHREVRKISVYLAEKKHHIWTCVEILRVYTISCTVNVCVLVVICKSMFLLIRNLILKVWCSCIVSFIVNVI